MVLIYSYDTLRFTYPYEVGDDNFKFILETMCSRNMSFKVERILFYVAKLIECKENVQV